MFRFTVNGVVEEFSDVAEMVAELRAIDAEYSTHEMDDAARARWNAINAAVDTARVRGERLAALARAGGTGPATEGGAVFHAPRHDADAPSMRAPQQYRDQALRAIERQAGVLSPEAGDRLDTFVRTGDRTGIDSRYIAAVADPHYSGAFGKVLRQGAMAHLSFSAKEASAWQEVIEAEQVRAMSVGVGSDGGYAVPFALDPTIMLTSDGSATEVRRFARTETISTDKWRGVTSAGVVASYDPELTEVSDDTPTFGQPEADTSKAQAWIEYSIEVGMDWSGVQSELGRLLADAKANLESDKFLGGTGVDEPRGVLGGTGTYAVAFVTGAGTGAMAVADIYSLVQAIPARWQRNLSVAGAAQIFDAAYRLVGGGSTEPPVLPTREGPLLGRRKFEWSNMAAAVATGNKVLIAGDWTEFLIVDRIGLSVELVPHVVGENHRPVGKRGLFAFWRNTSTVLVPNAFRALKIK